MQSRGSLDDLNKNNINQLSDNKLSASNNINTIQVI